MSYDAPVRVFRLPSGAVDAEPLLAHEWLVTNGLGGYSCGTVCGAATRRYHGLLVAALPAPLGRVMMLNHLAERLLLPDGTEALLGTREHLGERFVPPGAPYLREFRLEMGLPVWRHEVGASVVERRVYMPHQHNTVFVTYTIVAGEGTVELRLEPSVHFRPHEAPVSDALAGPFTLSASAGRFELASSRGDLPRLRLYLYAQSRVFTICDEHVPEVLYRVEQSRGYQARGDLYCVGHFRARLVPGETATLVASAEPWDVALSLPPDEALAFELQRRDQLLRLAVPALRSGSAAELVLAADQFVVTPATRTGEAARAHAAGDEPRTVIAGYHWFTDWGRDTMISLEGLALVTGRHREAAGMLRTFAHAVRDGLIPNMFPERGTEGLYNTADATLWFFHAIDRYLDATGDRAFLRALLPVLVEIVDRHVRGTRFGIGVDPVDGLVRQGAPGFALTWMDAKMDGWVVTPRRGKAVEINALFFNALRLLAQWVREIQGDPAARRYDELAERVKESFNRRFWCEGRGHLLDVVDGEDGDDPACRPNQLLAISLPHAVLDRRRWETVVHAVERQLLTPVGLRSLSPEHPQYKRRYFGDLRARDAAYHQGTVWAWLVGPFVDAWLKLHPDDRVGARRFLQGILDHLGEACLGQVSEIFDAEDPYTPRGCVAQAWSVAETLRCLANTSALWPAR
jgi:predicted glycogen debranching enzyme